MLSVTVMVVGDHAGRHERQQCGERRHGRGAQWLAKGAVAGVALGRVVVVDLMSRGWSVLARNAEGGWAAKKRISLGKKVRATRSKGEIL